MRKRAQVLPHIFREHFLMPRSTFGGRHELGQNFLHHQPTIERFASLVAKTQGDILELGAGDGALTRVMARQGRTVTAIDLDEHHVARLRTELWKEVRTTRSHKPYGPASDDVSKVFVDRADALTYPFDRPVIVGNVPFHLTTPILRRLLRERRWQQAVLLVQWEVARKRAGVGGGTMMTAQAAPWFEFALHGRVPSHGFAPKPSVDGGLLTIARRPRPLVPVARRSEYEQFVHRIFTGRGGSFPRVVQLATGVGAQSVRRALQRAEVSEGRLPRDLRAEQWATIWAALKG